MSNRTKKEQIQFIKDCYIPNNTNIRESQLPDGWEDYIDGKLTLNENIHQVNEFIEKVQTSEQKWDGFNHKNYYEKYKHMLKERGFKI